MALRPVGLALRSLSHTSATLLLTSSFSTPVNVMCTGGKGYSTSVESNVGEPKSKLETMTSWLKLSPIGGYVSTVLGISSYLKKINEFL